VEVDGATLWVERDGDGPPVLMPTGAGAELYREEQARFDELLVGFVDRCSRGPR
jgi:hypothetical protein